MKQKFVSIENQVKAYLSEENQTKEAEKENMKQESKKKAVILEDIQGLIKDYKKNATEKKSRYIFNPINEEFNYE